MNIPIIFALASGGARAAIAVVRLSGPGAGAAVRALAGPLPPPRLARLVKFRDPESKEILDRGLVVWFPGPSSFTGEDMVELHLHGGRAVVAGIVAALGRMQGLRAAEPGEFTRRAFDNGKFDLTEVEAMADLIDSETQSQRRQALRQLSGEFGRLVESWRARLLKALAYAEAGIDFAEDDPAVAAGDWRDDVPAVGREIAQVLADGQRGERLRDGLMVAILGPPNAGKSSLLNRLAGREAAIVAASAGTTRDVIEVHLDLGGYPVILADTAGLREAGDEIETEGVRRALARAGEADLKLAVVDAQAAGEIDSATKRIIDAATILVANKRDLVADAPEALRGLEAALGTAPRAAVSVSAKTGEGIAELLALVERVAATALMDAGGEPALITRARHRGALEECLAALSRFEKAGEAELGAEDLRLAAHSLGRITGRVDVEDILDVIFREFCIGK